MCNEALVLKTLDALDSIDLTYYLNVGSEDEVCEYIKELTYDDILDVMAMIQMDYERNRLPSGAMYVLAGAEFHHDVFRAIDEEDFIRYVYHRYEGDAEVYDIQDYCTPETFVGFMTA